MSNTSDAVSFGFKPRRDNWTSLRLLNVFRVGVAAIFFAQGFLDDSPLVVIQHLALYAWTTFAYLLLALVMTLAAWIERRNFQMQVSLQTYIDIIAIILIMHACGGIGSGLGMLLIISIAITGLLGKDSLATVFASLASVGLLAEHVYSLFERTTFGASSTQVGLLGATLFATALVTQTLTKRISSSEALIQKHKLDAANLAALNTEILRNMQSGVLALDSFNQVRHLNDTARKMLDIDTDLNVPFDCHTYLNDIYDALEIWVRNPNHSTALVSSPRGSNDIQIQFHALQSAAHKGTLVFLDDFSQIRLQMQQSKLASLGQLTANIAHEIRNPLGAISHAAQLLAENPDLPGTDHRLTEIVTQHSARINEIIEDIMQLSRGHVANQDHIDLAPWIERFIESFCLSGEASADCFNLEVEENGLELTFDSGHLNRILTNLCSNAKTHSDSDKPIHVRLRHGENRKVEIEIADQGKGIPREELDKVFEPFYTTSHKGSGLGLYIVGQLCELNDATVTVNRNEFGGTSFTIIK